MTPFPRSKQSLLASQTLPLVLLLALGCASGHAPIGPTAGAQLRGNLHGGQQPVAGASVQLYAAGSTGYGVGATPLGAAAITAADGAFFIPGTYTCPSPTSPLYLVATGGNPGLAPATDNRSLTMMAAIAPCNLLSGTTTVLLNEVTTVASVYVLAGFMDPATTEIGASTTNAIGLANSFATVNNLVDTSSGFARATTPAGNGSVPQAEINTLADILAPCINSTGAGPACSTLFAAATPTGGAAPTNTLQAALSIAQHPASQVAALYNQAAAIAPFQPTLTATPNDWTIAINHPVGEDVGFYSIAIDGLGNVWMGSDHSVAEIANDGTVLSGPAGYTGGGMNGTRGMAIDLSGNAWVANFLGNSVTKLSSSGIILSGSGGFTAGIPTLPGIGGPDAVAIDGFNNAWVLPFLGEQPYTVVELSNDGTPLSGANGFSPCSSGSACSLAFPVALAIDGSEDVWSAGFFPEVVTKLGNDGTALSGPGGFSIGLTNPTFIALDGSGNAWVANQVGNTNFPNGVTKLSSTGAELAFVSHYGMDQPVAVAIDGAGSAWITTSYNGRVTQLDNSAAVLSGPMGLVNGTPVPPYANCIPIPYRVSCERLPTRPGGIAVDSSGNVWINNLVGYASEFVGAATPVITPLSVGVRDHKLGGRP